jgi:hypothetical protein
MQGCFSRVVHVFLDAHCCTISWFPSWKVPRTGAHVSTTLSLEIAQKPGAEWSKQEMQTREVSLTFAHEAKA